MLRSPTLIASLSLILAGCATSPNLIEPETALATSLPKQFSTPISQQGASTVTREWWTEFSDPQLNQMIHSALSNNFSFKAAINRLEQSSAKAKQAGAATSPSLNASFDAERSAHSSSSSNDFQFGVMASYEFDLWSRLAATKQAAEFDYLASQQELEVTAITLSSEIALNWYQAITLNALIELYSQQLTVLDKQLLMLQLHHQYGQNDIEDIWQQQQLIQAAMKS